jgi:hypothetical protein
VNPRNRLLVLCVTLLATACGAPHLATIERAKANLQGQEAAALACIGEPLEQLPQATPETTLWRFSSAQPRDAAGRVTRDPSQPPEAHARACIADAHLQGGRITAITTTNRAGWGFGSIKACSGLLAGCTVGG